MNKSRQKEESLGGLELTRRSELQASCFEGMSLAALQNGGLSNDFIFPALSDSKDRGDEHTGGNDHGSLANNTTWIDRGFLDNDITRCNTWAAPPAAEPRWLPPPPIFAEAGLCWGRLSPS